MNKKEIIKKKKVRKEQSNKRGARTLGLPPTAIGMDNQKKQALTRVQQPAPAFFVPRDLDP